MGTEQGRWSENTKNAVQQVDAGGVQFVEDFGLVMIPRRRHISQHEAACGAIFECLWCAQTTRAMFAYARASSFFFIVEARTRLRRASATGHFSAFLG